MLKKLKGFAKTCVSASLTKFLGDESGLVTLKTWSGPAKRLRYAVNLRRMEYAY